MPDTLIHALKISAGLGMRVRRQIWEIYSRSADALSMRGNGRRMETRTLQPGATTRPGGSDRIQLLDWGLVGEERRG